MDLRIRPARRLHGRLRVPGDKSISHRAALVAAIAEGRSTVHGFLDARDCLATLRCLEALGARVQRPEPDQLVIEGAGLHGLRAPAGPLDCGGSGTTMRLLAGLLAGQLFAATLIGNEQLSRRPMGRVAEPLRLMGAQVALAAGERPPLAVTGSALRGIDYRLPVASAQVKSAVLLAGLYAEGETVVREPAPTRDHTEQLLAALGAPIERAPDGTRLRAPSRLRPLAEFVVPGDLSSAAFLVVAATIVADSDILLAAVGRNPTRTGLLDALAAMGGRCTWSSETADGVEPSGDLSVQAAPLRATTIAGALVPRLIDELPVLAVAATQATGVTEVRDAAELRVKESDRIGALAAELAKLGARIDPRPDGFAVHGPVQLRAATVDSHGDHRLAMALAIAALVADGETVVTGAECIADSFPGFAQALVALGATVETVD